MSKRVLLVEDDPSVLFITAQILARLGGPIDVIPVSGGDQAAALLNQGKIDLMITDLRMQPISGQELTRIGKKRRPELVVIWITAYHSEWVKSEANQLGVAHVLLKPVEASTIRRVVTEVLYSMDCLNHLSHSLV